MDDDKPTYRDRFKNYLANKHANEKLEQVQAHFKKNKTVYLCAITGIGVAGITGIVMRSNIARGGMGKGTALGGVTNTASFTFGTKQSIKVTTVLDREGRGHPGWPIRNLETKRISLSQREAANLYGIPEGRLSGHLKGMYPDVDGLHFERVNLQP